MRQIILFTVFLAIIGYTTVKVLSETSKVQEIVFKIITK